MLSFHPFSARAALAAVACLIALPAIAQTPPALPRVRASDGALMRTQPIQCVDDEGHKIPCAEGVSGGATAANQAAQTTATNQTNARIGDPAAPAIGTLLQRLSAITTTLGTPFQAGGAISNTAFGISGTLPPFAQTPSFTIGGSLPAFAQTPTVNVGGTLPGFTTPPTVNIGGNLPAFASTPTVNVGTAPADAGRTAAGATVPICVSATGALCRPVASIAQSNGTVTALAANTSTTVCPATTNPTSYEVQIYGTAPVLLGLDGQALTAITPAAGSGAFMLIPTQYSLYAGPVARTNAITAFTTTAQTVVCNIITRP